MEKRKERLESRKRDFASMKTNFKGEVKQKHAIENGGFHCPGSLKK